MEPLILRLGTDHQAIVDFCQRWAVVRLEVFGSVLRDDFNPDSDIDVMVTFAQGGKPKLHGLLTMEEELRAMFGRSVDMIERKLVESNPNWIRRRAILESAQQVWAA